MLIKVYTFILYYNCNYILLIKFIPLAKLKYW